MGWQPIETAPKDGTKLLLCSNVNGNYGSFAPCEWSKAGDISSEGFWLWWQASPEYLTEIHATHWQPLPEPPQ